MTYYIIGGGLAGLAAAVQLKQEKKQFELFEFASKAGGRVRSFYDSKLDQIIDNGAHLILGANKYLFRYLKMIGSENNVVKLSPEFKFYPVKAIPYSLKGKKLLHPEIRAQDYWALLKFCLFPANGILSEFFDKESALYKDYITPLCFGIQNIAPEMADAKCFQSVMRKILLTPGGSQAYFVRDSLQASLIDPAIQFLGKENLHFKSPLQQIEQKKGTITKLYFTNRVIQLSSHDKIIFALSPQILQKFFPDWQVEIAHQAILNIHIPYSSKSDSPYGFGITGGIAEWVFARKDYLSITISAGKKTAHMDRAFLIQKLRIELQHFFPDIDCSLSNSRFIEEKFATLLQTPNHKLPLPSCSNASFIGDWTHSCFPNSMEAAIETGLKIS